MWRRAQVGERAQQRTQPPDLHAQRARCVSSGLRVRNACAMSASLGTSSGHASASVVASANSTGRRASGIDVPARPPCTGNHRPPVHRTAQLLHLGHAQQPFALAPSSGAPRAPRSGGRGFPLPPAAARCPPLAPRARHAPARGSRPAPAAGARRCLRSPVRACAQCRWQADGSSPASAARLRSDARSVAIVGRPGIGHGRRSRDRRVLRA